MLTRKTPPPPPPPPPPPYERLRQQQKPAACKLFLRYLRPGAAWHIPAAESLQVQGALVSTLPLLLPTTAVFYVSAYSPDPWRESTSSPTPRAAESLFQSRPEVAQWQSQARYYYAKICSCLSYRPGNKNLRPACTKTVLAGYCLLSLSCYHPSLSPAPNKKRVYGNKIYT